MVSDTDKYPQKIQGHVMINQEALLDLWNQKGRWMFTDQMSAGFRHALDLIHDMIPDDFRGIRAEYTPVYCTATGNYYIGIVEPDEISLEQGREVTKFP